MHNRRIFAVVILLAVLLPAAGFPQPLVDGPVVWYEDDRRPIPEPRERDPNLIWDYVDDSLVLPIQRLTHPGRLIRRVGTVFGGDPVAAAANVNTLDEVPNSTWFTNRIGLFPLSPERVARGAGTGSGPDRTGKWTVVSAKTQGVTPGFSIRDARGGAYLIKFDPPGHLGMTTGAGVICDRILYAAGYNVPDDAVVIFDRNDLVLGEDVKIKTEDGSRRSMTEDDLGRIFTKVDRLPDGRIHAISSKYLEGTPIGPFDYHGRRKDDPNDLVRHEDRRELRGLAVFSAWLGHHDTKQHNSLDTFVGDGGTGYVRHHLIDFASTLGAGAKGLIPRYNYEYTFDPEAMVHRALALGLYEDPWRRLKRPEGVDEVGYLESREFELTGFKPVQPNSAFANLTDRDGYWAAKIISAFTDGHLRAIVEQAGFRNPEATRYVARVLGERRDKIARYFFDRVAPLDFFVYSGNRIEFHDLGAERGIYPGTRAGYRVRLAAARVDRSNGGWTDWFALEETVIPADGPEARSVLDDAGPSEYPFLAVECQVNRGRRWSSPVRVYLSRARRDIIALDR